jgi:AcrR family transcriptional regulator
MEPGDGQAPRGRGRPRGRTAAGEQARQHLYAVAIEQIARNGYEATTLREIARVAGVSPGLLYRYFPSKGAVVLALYDELSATYAEAARALAPGPWTERALFALQTSLDTLRPHRRTLAALVPVLVGDASEGLFAERTAFSRYRVQPVFVQAVAEAQDAPAPEVARALGRLLYLAHLAVLLWWVLDRSPEQRATAGLLRLIGQTRGLLAFALQLPGMSALLTQMDELARDALLGEDPPG